MGDPADRHRDHLRRQPECPHRRGLDNDAFTQLPDGAQVEVIGTEGEWVKVLLPEREGYVHSDYLTITDTGSFSLSLDGTNLSALLELFASGLSGGGGAAFDPGWEPVPH